MAQRKPRSLHTLGQISGVGKTKLERYGDAFLAIILEHAGDEPAVEESSIFNLQSSTTSDTYEETLQLILEGYGLEAIANMRGLKLRTVENHLAELVERGQLTVEEATGLPKEEIALIRGGSRNFARGAAQILKTAL